MRLACYGWVGEHAGSMASAGYVVVAELLRQGVEVDLFAHREHVPCPSGLPEGPFRYFGLSQPRWLDVVDLMPGRTPALTRKLLDPLCRSSWRRVYQPVAEREHQVRTYDALLTLGTRQAFTIDELPTVSWLQSPLHTELEAIRRLRTLIVASSGLLFYRMLVANYQYAQLLAKHRRMRPDCVILPSEWARSEMAKKETAPGLLRALPYPIDLGAFTPANPPRQDWSRPILLWLGRIDPRKRLDLLLEAFPLIRAEVPGARLRIVGRPGYAAGSLSRLSTLAAGGDIEYRPHVPRQEVVPILQEAAVLVQPSENENFGSSVAEAQACGVPVVLGPSNGTRDYIDRYSTVFADYSPRSLARAVVATVQRHRGNPVAAQQSARASAEHWFSPRTVAAHLIEIVEATVQRVARERPRGGGAA